MAESEQKIDYEAAYYKEQERLAKLWDAYEEQVEVIQELEKKIRELKKEIEEKDTTIENLEELLSQRDEKIREYEKEIVVLKKKQEKYEPHISELEAQLDEEREKVVKLFELSQDLQDELNLAKDALKARDSWFVENIQHLENMCQTIEERKKILQGEFKKYLEIAKKIEKGEEEEKEEEEEELTREEALKEFTKIEGIDEELAGKIWEHLAKNIQALVNIKKHELVKLEGVTPSKADKIMQAIRNYKISEYIKSK